MLNPVFRIHHGHVLDVLRGMESESVHCVVTSPPYWGLRDYGTATWQDGDDDCDHNQQRPAGANDKSATNKGASRDPFTGGDCRHCGAVRLDQQIGLEPTPDTYAMAMVEVFREVKRVLRKDGTCWLNLGDSYCGYWGDAKALAEDRPSSADTNGWTNGFNMNARPKYDTLRATGLKPKDLVGIPWRVAFALQSDGWWLRSDIIWSKPNPMPESVTDRPTKAHEYIFLLTKSARYFFDAEAVKEANGWPDHNRFGNKNAEARRVPFLTGNMRPDAPQETERTGRNIRSVWTMTTQAFSEAHFAVFPTEIPRRAILAGTSEKGVCGQCGAPWARVVEKTNGEPDSWHGSKFDDGKNLELHPTTQKRASVKAMKQSESDRYRRLTTNTNRLRDEGGDHDNPFPKTKTLGWQPTCEHEGELMPATVLDPFCGSGTTGLVALQLGQNFVGIELNESYVAMARNRITNDAPLLNREAIA